MPPQESGARQGSRHVKRTRAGAAGKRRKDREMKPGTARVLAAAVAAGETPSGTALRGGVEGQEGAGDRVGDDLGAEAAEGGARGFPGPPARGKSDPSSCREQNADGPSTSVDTRK